MEITQTFGMNGHGYETDLRTLTLLREIVPQAIETKDTSAVEWVMALGQMGGCIRQIS